MTQWMENNYSNKKGNRKRQVMTIYEPKLADKQAIGEKI